MVHAGDRVRMLLVRGDHMGNEVKIGKLAGFDGWRWATDAEIVAATGCRPGFLGPVGTVAGRAADRRPHGRRDGATSSAGRTSRDSTWPGSASAATAANRTSSPTSATWSPATPPPTARGPLEILRGIEVGHVFALGTRYSQDMGATYLDAQGQSRLIEMGCYGIGVTRVVAAAIEQNHDERGIAWPKAMAPWTVAIAAIGYDRSEAVRALADRLHDELEAAGVDVLLDDRGERPGVMFADLELLGLPLRVTIGDRGLKDGKVEVQGRRETAATPVPVDGLVDHLRQRIETLP